MYDIILSKCCHFFVELVLQLHYAVVYRLKVIFYIKKSVMKRQKSISVTIFRDLILNKFKK